jgi:hypothetical protein
MIIIIDHFYEIRILIAGERVGSLQSLSKIDLLVRAEKFDFFISFSLKI